MIIANVTMDLTGCGTPRVYAVQGDKNTRGIRMWLYQNGQPYDPGAATVVVRYCRPDGCGGSYDALEDGGKAGFVGDNAVTVYLAPAVLSVPGPVRLAVGLMVGETEINTFTVIVDVEANPGLVPTAEGYYKVLGSLPETAITFGTEDLVAGVSPLPVGTLYFVYE